MERVGRFSIPVWTKFFSVGYENGEIVDKEITRNFVIGSAQHRVPDESQFANRFIIGNKLEAVHFEVNGEDRIFVMNDNYTFDDCGLYKNFDEHPIYNDFIDARKKDLAIEKLSGSPLETLSDDKYAESDKFGIILVGEDGKAYSTITHKGCKQRGMSGLWNYMQDLYYPVMEDGKLVMKQLDYLQNMYLCTGKAFASYINLPEGMCYIMYNSNAYDEEGYVLKEQKEKTAFFKNGEFVENENENATVEELVKEFEAELKQAALNCDPVSAQPDMTDDKVEKYIG